MKKILWFAGMIIVLNSCFRTEFKIQPIPNTDMYWESESIKYEYFDVSNSDGLNDKQIIEKLKQHTLQSLTVDSVKKYDYHRIYYKHSYFYRYNTSFGSKWDSEGTRDTDSPDLFGAFDRKIGVVDINDSGSVFKFRSYIDKSTNRFDEIDSTFLAKMLKYHSKKEE